MDKLANRIGGVRAMQILQSRSPRYAQPPSMQIDSLDSRGKWVTRLVLTMPATTRSYPRRSAGMSEAGTTRRPRSRSLSGAKRTQRGHHQIDVNDPVRTCKPSCGRDNLLLLARVVECLFCRSRTDSAKSAGGRRCSRLRIGSKRSACPSTANASPRIASMCAPDSMSAASHRDNNVSAIRRPRRLPNGRCQTCRPCGFDARVVISAGPSPARPTRPSGSRLSVGSPPSTRRTARSCRHAGRLFAACRHRLPDRARPQPRHARRCRRR
jgi:hypothetical protein